MGRFRLLFRKSVGKDLHGIPKKDVARILRRFNALTDERRGPGSEEVSGQERYRVCQGAYRIIYEIRDDALEVVVVGVGHRRDVYRNS
jgi:mRNA interferase RelE/StbE